ncbi:STIV orfB116 family protein [Phaeodactylibacter xiamenensis]|uniref:STIV orfB116 family protein n=1 Tax=Phaeodactylibacter xiamenensis TaxID=1524460 RepID=UPI003CCBCF76
MRQTHILNSAVMPKAGCYNLKAISANDFFLIIQKQRQEDPEGFFTMSWIGYEQNAQIIADKTGWRPPICRSVTEIEHGDRLLIMRLKYRPEEGAKGKPVQPHDFEYFEGFYTERVPVPSYIDILNLDIYEAEAQRYINELAQLTGAGTVLDALNYTRRLMDEIEDGQDERWRELHEDYTGLLRMHFDPEGYRKESNSYL